MWYYKMNYFPKGGAGLDLNWFESFLYGLFSGLGDILPISAEAHQLLMLKFFGVSGDLELIRLFARLGVCGALFVVCRPQLVRMRRARALKRVPKRRRRRPLDVRSLMDSSLLITMLVPVALALCLKSRVDFLGEKLIWVAALLLVNGVILYIPQFFPSANRDSRTLSRVQGLLIGLGGALGILPGVSGMGAALSVGSVCGVDRSYGLGMALLMELFFQAGLAVLDVMALIAAGAGTLSFVIFLRYLFTAAVAFGGAYLAARLMRTLAGSLGYSLFGYYCWGIALFTFVLNLMA